MHSRTPGIRRHRADRGEMRAENRRHRRHGSVVSDSCGRGERGNRLPIACSQCDMEYGSAMLAVLRPDAATMSLDNRPRDREAQSHAFLLRAEERVEELWQLLGRNAMTPVAHGNGNAAVDALD